MSNTFTPRAFARALGRISAAVPAFDEAVRHAVYHGLMGQVTPARRLWQAAKDGGHTGGAAWRIASESFATATLGACYLKAGEWTAKPGRPILTEAEAVAKALALPALADAVQAAAEAKAAKAAEAKEARKAKVKEAEAKEAEAKVRGLSYDGEAESILAKLVPLALADIEAVKAADAARALADKAPAPADGAAPVAVPAPVLRLVPMLAGMPGASSALAGVLALAGALSLALADQAEAARTGECLESFAKARADALALAEQAKATRAHAAKEAEEAKAEADAIMADALALAEQAAETRRTAKAKAAEALAAKADSILAAEAAGAEAAKAEAEAAGAAVAMVETVAKAKVPKGRAKAKAETLPA